MGYFHEVKNRHTGKPQRRFIKDQTKKQLAAVSVKMGHCWQHYRYGKQENPS